MMKNAQPPEKVDIGDGSSLDVVQVWSTIQGEGPYTGTPATFVRLAGCNLQCPLCDTDYTTARWTRRVEHLAQSVVLKRNRLVVITGGEPFRQNITKLCTLLLEKNHLVQVETNGVVDPPPGFRDLQFKENTDSCRLCVVCSPKTSKVSEVMKYVVDAWKYVVKAGEVEPDGLPTAALGMSGIPAKPTNNGQVYIQPLDEKDVEVNQQHMKAAVESCLKHGHRLCLQLHKIAGLD